MSLNGVRIRNDKQKSSIACTRKPHGALTQHWCALTQHIKFQTKYLPILYEWHIMASVKPCNPLAGEATAKLQPLGRLAMALATCLAQYQQGISGTSSGMASLTLYTATTRKDQNETERYASNNENN
jgi:hypothetical protein